MKAKSFYKNNKHNNMDSKEKENINEEELKAQDAQDETCEETTEKEEEVALTEEEKLTQELQKANHLYQYPWARITNAMKSTIQKIQTTLMKPEVKKAGTEQIKKKAKSSIIEQLSRKKKEMAEREVSRTIPAKSKKQDMEL